MASAGLSLTTDRTPRCRGELSLRIRCERDDRSALVEQRLTGLGETYATGRSLEERSAKLVLERPDTFARRRLGDPELHRGL